MHSNGIADPSKRQGASKENNNGSALGYNIRGTRYVEQQQQPERFTKGPIVNLSNFGLKKPHGKQTLSSHRNPPSFNGTNVTARVHNQPAVITS
mmetsp:Transcript_20441/g.27617  ORF Transcript_20441/g.27617 Transcript_20441/m.27617 type:complete len:94 (-) Transcript_20441:1644-1925(-)